MGNKVIITDNGSKLVQCPNCGFKVSAEEGICFVCGAPLRPNTGRQIEDIKLETDDISDEEDLSLRSDPDEENETNDTMEIMKVFGKGHREVVHAEYDDNSEKDHRSHTRPRFAVCPCRLRIAAEPARGSAERDRGAGTR